MKFEFSLEPVLKVRKHKEKIQKQKLAEKLNKKKNLKNIKESLEEELKNHIGNADNNKFVNLHDFQRQQQHIEDLHEKMQEVTESLDTIKKAVNKQRNKLEDVHKKRHIMEKVKEEERELVLEKMAKKERKVMDEVATQTFSK